MRAEDGTVGIGSQCVHRGNGILVAYVIESYDDDAHERRHHQMHTLAGACQRGFVLGFVRAKKVDGKRGLDQDMMQRNLACRNSGQSQKNMIVSGVVQFFVIALFLLLGTLMLIYMDSKGVRRPEKSDEIFGMIAFHSEMPVIVGILFVLGLIAAARNRWKPWDRRRRTSASFHAKLWPCSSPKNPYLNWLPQSLQMVLGFIVGYFVIAFLLVPMFYRRNLISIYGYLEGRFGQRT